MIQDIQMPAEQVPNFFFNGRGGLHRKLADGTFKPIRSMNGGRLVTMHKGERLYGIDIAWCLRYGNWPMFPLTCVSGDPYDLTEDNVFPVRLRFLRYRETERAGDFFHPLSEAPYRDPIACKASWVMCATDEYRKDLAYVEHLEQKARELRRASLPKPETKRLPVSAKPDAASNLLPKRPARVPGRVWHYYRKAWLSVPEPVHVSDDYRVRCLATLCGAEKFAYDPDYQQTLAYMPDGSMWQQPEGERA